MNTSHDKHAFPDSPLEATFLRHEDSLAPPSHAFGAAVDRAGIGGEGFKSQSR